MRRRGLLVCTVVVVTVHGAIIETLAGHLLPRSGGSAQEPGQLPGAHLVLLDRERVNLLTLPPAGAPPEQTVALAQLPGPAASATARNADASASGTKEGAPTLRPASVIYRSPAELDQPVRPRSAPDLSMLSGLAWTGMPIRLRLFIDSGGVVVDTQVLQSNEDVDVVTHVRRMFSATGFTPGTVQGQPVPCYKDIEIIVGSRPEEPAPLVRQ